MAQHIFRPIDITSVQTDNIVCKHDVINFFEIVFIEEGTGIQRIDRARIPFGPGGVFLLLPEERCTIELTTWAKVHLIRFQPAFFRKPDLADTNELLNRLELISRSAARPLFPLLVDEQDRTAVTNLLRVLVAEYQTHQDTSYMVQKNLLVAVLAIIARNLQQDTYAVTPSKRQALLSFIRHHISEPEELTIRVLSHRFAIAESYFSEYFKTTFGLSLKQYVMQHRLSLVDVRLAYTDLTLSEIAAEVGFTDSSHLKKTYLNYRLKPIPQRSVRDTEAPQNTH